MDRNDKEPPAKKRRKKRQPCGKCCSVWGCSNSRKKDGLGVFGFPKPDQEPERHAEWVRVVSHTRANFKYHPTSSFICADHFPVESISNLTKIRLLSASNPHDNTPWKLVPDAVPIISKLPPRPRPGSTHTTKPTRRRPAAVKRERRRLVDAALQAEAEKMAPPAPAELDDLGEPSNNPDHPNYIFLKVEDNLEGNLESNHKEPVSESTMSNKKHSETVDGLVIKEESDNIFVADNDMMEKVKEEREDEMVVWKIEDDVTFKEESLDMDMEDDSYPYEDCEDPLLTLKCKSCEKVCATRSDLETHTENMHGSGKHPRGQKRKKLVKSKRDRLHDHGKSSCDKTLATTRPSPPPRKRQANSSHSETLALVDAVHGRRDVIDSSHMPQENHRNNQQFPATEKEWKTVGEQFEFRWNFPHCLGAVDGKHVWITPPSESGSYYWNYKGYNSLVLMAVVNANYEFIMADIGTNGHVSDGGVIDNTEFGKRLKDEKLCIPHESVTATSNCVLPYVFVGDEAFALRTDFLKPYSQKDLHSEEKRVFNYRLSRARRVAENAFGIMASRFRIFHTCINLKLTSIDKVVMACVVLHNYLRKACPSDYSPEDCFHREDRMRKIILPGLTADPNYLAGLQHGQGSRNYPEIAKVVRDRFKDYFVNAGAVAWQKDFI